MMSTTRSTFPLTRLILSLLLLTVQYSIIMKRPMEPSVPSVADMDVLDDEYIEFTPPQHTHRRPNETVYETLVTPASQQFDTIDSSPIINPLVNSIPLAVGVAYTVLLDHLRKLQAGWYWARRPYPLNDSRRKRLPTQTQEPLDLQLLPPP